MKNICFIANFEKTAFFESIAQKLLEQKNYNIYWLVVNKKQSEKLKLKFGDENVCLINKKVNCNYFNKELINKIRLNEILFQDRSLNEGSKDDLNYLELATSKIYEFLNINNIKYIYGELTWAHELITLKICDLNKSLNCKFFSPSTIRFPLDHFLFFTNSEQSKFFKRSIKFEEKISKSTENYLSLVQSIRPKNLYYSYEFIFKKIKKIFYEDYFDKHDPTRISRIRRGLKLLNKFINLFLFNFISKKNLNYLKKKKYIIYFLQKQPEASIDVKGVYYENQLANFRNLWRLVPSDFKILIKEHPNSIGDNNLIFYRNFTKFNNSILIEDMDNFESIVTDAFATFSVASTASMQSAMLNVPSFTLSNCFFNEMKFSHRISLEEIKNFKNIYELMDLFYKVNEMKNNYEQSDFVKNSFNGKIIGEGKFENKNLVKVMNAFIETTIQSDETNSK